MQAFPRLTSQQAELGKIVLTTAVLTIVFAEIYALFAAAARTPGVYQWLPGSNFFYVALVTHVNLSIVIWFLVFTGLLALISQVVLKPLSGMARLSIGTGVAFAASGMTLIVLAPFLGADSPIMANYIPVLNHPLFISALGLLFFGVSVMLSFPFWKSNSTQSVVWHAEFAYGIRMAGLTFGVAMFCFLLAFWKLEGTPDTLPYFETFFWGGGHILQFVNTLAMLSCWILLAHLSLKKLPLSSFVLKALLSSVFLFALPAPFFYFFYGPEDAELIEGFTFLMRWGLGPATIPIGGVIVWKLFKQRLNVDWQSPYSTSLLASIALFAYGGIIGALIDQSNVKIPAHYHGVIGAVTLSFMGASYALLPALGKIWNKSRMIFWQPILCGGGGVLFVTGMYWAGTHGVARKVSGAAQGLDNLGKMIGMSLMGLGGLVTLFGVVAFVAVVLRALYPKTVPLKLTNLVLRK